MGIIPVALASEGLFDPVRTVVAGQGGHVGAGDGCPGRVEEGEVAPGTCGGNLLSSTHLPLFQGGGRALPPSAKFWKWWKKKSRTGAAEIGPLIRNGHFSFGFPVFVPPLALTESRVAARTAFLPID